MDAEISNTSHANINIQCTILNIHHKYFIFKWCIHAMHTKCHWNIKINTMSCDSVVSYTIIGLTTCSGYYWAYHVFWVLLGLPRVLGIYYWAYHVFWVFIIGLIMSRVLGIYYWAYHVFWVLLGLPSVLRIIGLVTCSGYYWACHFWVLLGLPCSGYYWAYHVFWVLLGLSRVLGIIGLITCSGYVFWVLLGLSRVLLAGFPQDLEKQIP